MNRRPLIITFFFFNDTATTEIYTLSLHDALPISCGRRSGSPWRCGRSHVHPDSTLDGYPFRWSCDECWHFAAFCFDAKFKSALSIPFEWPSTAPSFQLAFLWKSGRIPDPCPWCARAEESLASQAFERAQVPPAQNWPAENSLR